MRVRRTLLPPENRVVADAGGDGARHRVGSAADRTFDGDLWACWRKNLQGKVVGLTWEAFRRQVAEHNPGLVYGSKGERSDADDRPAAQQQPGRVRPRDVTRTAKAASGSRRCPRAPTAGGRGRGLPARHPRADRAGGGQGRHRAAGAHRRAQQGRRLRAHRGPRLRRLAAAVSASSA